MIYKNKISIAVALIGVLVGSSHCVYAMDNDPDMARAIAASLQTKAEDDARRENADRSSGNTAQPQENTRVYVTSAGVENGSKSVFYRPSQSHMTYEEFLADFSSQTNKNIPGFFNPELQCTLVKGQILTKDNFSKHAPKFSNYTVLHLLTKPKN
jgi:hypothetical protein